MPLTDATLRRAYDKARYAVHREKRRAQARVRYVTNRDRCCAQAKAWKAANRERVRVISKARYAANRERARAYRKAYYAAHQGRGCIQTKAWRTANPERGRATCRAWRLANPEQTRLNRINGAGRRRASKRGLIVTKTDLVAIKVRDRMTCYLCRRRVSEVDLSFDHVTPLAVGGSHVPENIRVTHLACNFKKGTKLVLLPLEKAMNIRGMRTAL